MDKFGVKVTEEHEEREPRGKGKEMDLGQLVGLKESEPKTRPKFDKLTLAKITDVKTFINEEREADTKGSEFMGAYLQVHFSAAGKDFAENYGFRMYDNSGIAQPYIGKKGSLGELLAVTRQTFGKGEDLASDFRSLIGKECFVVTENRNGYDKTIVKQFKL